MSDEIILVVGARPNFMKIAPIYKELERRGQKLLLLHTGQHYDENMSKVFFEDLGMPSPDIYLGIGSGSHAYQTGTVMIEFEKICLERNPKLVVVVGDVNSTLACAIVSSKLGILCAHVEAGLRSFDRNMPEEINRILTDSISDILLTPSLDGDENLLNEGIDKSKIFRVGNVMIDSLFSNLKTVENNDIANQLSGSSEYALVTLHRPSNVDDIDTFNRIINSIIEISIKIKIIFPIHPRTRKMADKFNLLEHIKNSTNIILIEPVGYFDFISLMSKSKFVLTDSGGLQEETTALGIPCITLRENTERPITVSEGTNTLVGTDKDLIISTSNEILNSGGKKGQIPDLWDGKSAKRIADVLLQFERT
ncbi:MAG: UDP-N-acetylglucosamine 2-epimerase (non-hydrolyzing) [Candidatus Poseidoniales archaeon]